MKIKTNRITLRPFSISDVKDFFEISSDSIVTEYLTWGPHQLITEAEISIKNRFLDNPDVFCIELNSDKKCIGIIDVRIDKTNNKAGFGYMLNRNYWGHGLMTETLTAILDNLFNSLKVNKVESSCYVGNEGSGRVMEKCGMLHECTQIESLIIKNRSVDVINYGITSKQFNIGIYPVL